MKTDNNINYVRKQIELFAKDGTNIVDATCGNGNDSLYLATKYPNSKIYAFDIQEKAIERAKEKCINCNNIEYICDSHANIKSYAIDQVSLAIFNLGYLPNADETITTEADETIKAIANILELLSSGGAIVITLYRGKTNLQETEQVMNYLRTINKDFFIVSMYDLINLNGNPFNVIIERK